MAINRKKPTFYNKDRGSRLNNIRMKDDLNIQLSTLENLIKDYQNGMVGASSTDFIGLSDTPSAFGSSNQILQVNSAGDALEFVNAPVGVIVEDVLTSTSSINSLSANQGRELMLMLDAEIASTDAEQIAQNLIIALNTSARHDDETLGPNIPPQANDATGSIGTDNNEYAAGDHKHPAQSISIDAGNLLEVGTDGLHFLGTEEVDSDSGVNLIAANRTRVNPEGLKTIVLGAAPINGTTTAYFVGQLFWDNVNKKLYEATAKSTNPDTAGTGSTFAEVKLSGENANTRVFLTNTVLTGFAALATAGKPTEVEIKAYNDSLTTPHIDKLLVYNGTDIDGESTYVFHTDATATITLLQSPSNGGATIQTLNEATISWNGTLGQYAKVDDTLGTTALINSPTNVVDGEFYVLKYNNATGNDVTLEFDPDYKDKYNDSMDDVVVKSGDERIMTFVGNASGEMIATSYQRYHQGSAFIGTGSGIVYPSIQTVGERVNWRFTSNDSSDRTGSMNNFHTEYEESDIFGKPMFFTFEEIGGTNDWTIDWGTEFVDSDDNQYPDIVVPAGGRRTFLLISDGTTAFTVTEIKEYNSTITATLLDSSTGIDAKVLPAATGSGDVLFFANKDVSSNNATLTPQNGESLNGVTDRTFLFSNYANGTQFVATDVSNGEWIIAVEGSSTSELLTYYSIKGVIDNYDFITGEDILTLGSMVDSDTLSGGILKAVEIDSKGLRTGDVITIDKTGLYDVSFGINRPESALVGSNTQVTNTFNRAGYKLNGTDIIWLDVNSTGGLDDAFDFSGLIEFAEGDQLELIVNGSAATSEDIYVYFSLKEQPTQEVVLAGMVTSTSLSSLFASVGTDMVGIGDDTDIVFTDIKETVGTDISLNTSTGEFTLKAGQRYELEASLFTYNYTNQNGQLNVSWVDASNNFLSISQAAIYVPVNRINLNIAQQPVAKAIITPTVDTVVKLRVTGATGTATIFNNTSWVSVKSVPTSTVVMPDALDVGDLHYGYFHNDNPGGANIDLPLGISNGFEGLTFNSNSVTITQDGLYEIFANVNGNQNTNYDVLIRVNGLTRIFGSGVQNAVTGSVGIKAFGATELSAGDVITVRSTNNQNRNFVLKVDQKTTKTVINTTDTPTNMTQVGTPLSVTSDKEYTLQWNGSEIVNTLSYETETTGGITWSCNHLTGELIQRGIATTTSGLGSITLPVNFNDTNYVVTGSVEANTNLKVQSVTFDDHTISSFSFAKIFIFSNGNAGGFVTEPMRWTAIGTKA